MSSSPLIAVTDKGLYCERGDFYILCPDNETPRPLDEKRIQWTADDIIKNRPALSRWHPDYEDAFKAFVSDDKKNPEPQAVRGKRGSPG